MEGNKLVKEISKRPTGAFYVDGKKAFFYEQSLSAPLGLDFPQGTISDLEVVNRKKLDSLIQSFVKSYKIAPTNIVIVLSTLVTFERDFPQGSVEMEKNIEEFLELVPFEDHISKKALFSGTTKIVAANRELCEAIKSAFQNLGFVVTGVYPLSFCQQIMPQLQTNLDLSLIISKVPEMREFNLLPEFQIPEASPAKEKKDNKRIYMLVGVFGLLIVILLFFFYKNIISTPESPKTLPTPVVTPLPINPSVEALPTGAANIPEAFSTPSANTQNPNINQ